jgi:hypothetical protein
VPAKLAAFFITLLINIAIGAVVLFFLLITMNGYGEPEATYGLGAYIVLALLVSLLMSAGAAFLVHVLLKRKFAGLVSVLIAVPIFSVVGAGMKVISGIIGVLIAEFVRTNY